MLRLDKVIKPWKESAALNDHINLYGFWNETAFLTKSGDLGMVLSVSGVDYESLDRSEQEYAVKRLEAALKAFGPGFHVCQYLFKSNRPDIPFAKYDDPIVEAAIDQRRKFFEAKRDHLYQVEIFYCILLEGARSKTGVGAAIARILRDPAGAIGELKVQFTNDSMKTLLGTHIEHDLRRLDQSVQAFARQLSDFMQIEILNQQGQFIFFRRLLNYDDWRVAGRPQSTQFLDYQVVNSDIEAERDHLRVSDQVPDDVGGKEPSFWIIGGQEFDDAEPVLLMLPVWLEIVFVLRCQDRQMTFFHSFGSRIAVQERYNESSFFRVLSCSLQGVAVRPLPCNYNVIQPISALSRRKRGFKSRRGRQINSLGRTRLLPV
jgi:hypothetical protein